MALPPVVPGQKALDDAVRQILHPFATRCGKTLITILDALARGKHKSRNELKVDYTIGVIRSIKDDEVAQSQLRNLSQSADDEQHRELALGAIDLVPYNRLIMPATAIVGKIVTNSQFDFAEPEIWELWKQLLARACDSKRVGEAHPSYPWIISQLSSDEARLANILLQESKPYSEIKTKRKQNSLRRTINLKVAGSLLKHDPDQIMRHIDHLEALGLIYYLDDSWDIKDNANLFYVLTESRIQGHISFTAFGDNFMKAVGKSRP